MKNRRCFAIAVLCVAMLGCEGKPVAPSAQPPQPGPLLEAPALWGNLSDGDFWVGYRTVWMKDPSRALVDGSARPIQASVWYPAEPYPGTAPLRYRDYLGLAASELAMGPASDEAVSDELARYLGRLEEANVSSEAAESLMNAELAARPDIPPAESTYPLVLIAQGHGNSPNRQTVMCEYLASHGFVVITMPSQARISGFPKTEEELPGKIEEQAADLAFLAAHANDLSPVPTAGLGVIGYSFGARSALAFVMQAGGVGALISIDGGIANAQGKGVLERAAWFEPERMRTPLLHVYQPGDAYVDPDFDLVESLSGSERLLVRVGGLEHGHFSNSGMLRTLEGDWSGLIAEDLDPQPAFEQTLAFVRTFLRAHLEDDRLELEALVAAGVTGPVEDVRVIASGGESEK